jgi:hypothetical protein
MCREVCPPCRSGVIVFPQHSANGDAVPGCWRKLYCSTKETIWWSNLRHDMQAIIGQQRRLTPVSLEVAKSAPVQLLAGDGDLSVNSHPRTHNCVEYWGVHGAVSFKNMRWWLLPS